MTVMWWICSSSLELTLFDSFNWLCKRTTSFSALCHFFRQSSWFKVNLRNSGMIQVKPIRQIQVVEEVLALTFVWIIDEIAEASTNIIKLGNNWYFTVLHGCYHGSVMKSIIFQYMYFHSGGLLGRVLIKLCVYGVFLKSLKIALGMITGSITFQHISLSMNCSR